MRHLNYEDRIRIETLYAEKYSTHEVATHIGCSERTIRNELKRGYYQHLNKDYTYSTLYSADIAQQDYNYKASAKGAPLKLEKDFRFVRFCEACILRLHWSPDTVIGFIRKRGLRFACKVCTKPLYNYIEAGLFLNLSNKHLSIKSNRKKKNINKVVRIKKPLYRCITERDGSANFRADFGHWEMDTVIGKRNEKTCLLVLTERKTRFEIVMKLRDKTQAEVMRALNKLERCNKDFKHIFKTITVDNGSEFLNCALLEKSLFTKSNRTTVYYCHPYASCERGSNENANKLIRRFLPKGQSMQNVTNAMIQNIQNWMNRLPRKIHDYETALDLLKAHNITIR